MVKVEKERKFKTEYIPVYISSAILVLFICLLVLTINYEGNTEDTMLSSTTNAKNEELAITKTDSSCSQDELNELLNLANNVSGDYQATSKKVPVEKTEENTEYYEDVNGMEDYRYIEIIIKGLKEGVYAQITNNFNDDIVTIKTSDLNEQGEYRYEAPNMDQIVTYTVSIYADKYACSGEVIRKVGFDTKMYNTKSDMLACIMYPKYEGCNKLVDKAITIDEFNKGLEKFQKNNKNFKAEANANILNAFSNSNIYTADDVLDDINNRKPDSALDKVINKIKDNIELIIISISAIGIAILIVVLIMFIRRHRL